MIEKIISPLKKKPIIVRALESAILGYFVVNPLCLILVERAHAFLTHKQLDNINHPIHVSLMESFQPEFWLFSVPITLATIVIGIGLMAKDLKNQKLAEKNFAEQLRRITQTLNSVNHPIFELDLELNYTASNTYYLDLLGYKELGDIIGKNYRDVYEEDDISEFKSKIEELVKKGHQIEYILDSRFAHSSKVKRTLNPVKDLSGDIKGVVVEAIEIEGVELEDIVTICSQCKSVKIDGAFVPVEKLLPHGLGFKPRFSHGLCPYCFEKLIRDIE